jgi:hypothetical protein
MRRALTSILFVSILLMGSECERTRLDGLDNGLLTTPMGETLRPVVFPWTIVAQEFEDESVFYDAIEYANDSFYPLVVFDGEISEEHFLELEFASDVERYGTVIVSVGSLETPEWDFDLDLRDTGGITTLRWSDNGDILFADIVMNIDYAYDSERFREFLLHELGHTLGLDHDETSIDLGSCMSSPPAYDCSFTENDVEEVSAR